MWAKVDDKLFSHPKWLATSTPGKALWVSALSWCASQENDGHVPVHVLPMLGATKAGARALVASGLWEEADGGYVFHDWIEYQPDGASQKAKREAESDGGKKGMHTRWHTNRGLKVPGCRWCESDPDRMTDREPNKGPYTEPYSPLNTPAPARTRTRITTEPIEAPAPPITREDEPPEPNPQPEFQNVGAVLQAAGLAQREIRDFLVDLKGNGTRNTTALVNALHRDRKLAARIAEWRDERNLAAEASARPKPGKRTTDDRVTDGLRLAAELAAESGSTDRPNLRIIEGA